MRLLHVLKIINDDHGVPTDITFTFEEFFVGPFMPEYAILSHTWGSEEVSYQELAASSSLEHLDLSSMLLRSDQVQNVKKKNGYQKILHFCNQLSREGLEYGWVDTCCIDKTSSAELSEAINSMYQWYECSQICIAYLADVHGSYSFPEGQRRSRWFRRGWTLQELIAPKVLLFFDSEWKFLFDRDSKAQELQLHTGIDCEFLTGLSAPTKASVAQRMSWACGRESSRPEDIAYCLLGIFQVNMPMLYGEGKRAFIRLQEAIMQDSSDQSLFAWSDCDSEKADNIVILGWDRLSGPFASSPAQFAHASNIFPYHHKAPGAEHRMTNEDLRIELPVYKLHQSSLMLGILNCVRANHNKPPTFTRVAIYLRSIGTRHEQQYARKQPVLGNIQRITNRHGLYLASEPHPISGLQLAAVYPLAAWREEDSLFSGLIKEVVLGYSLSSCKMVAISIATKLDAEISVFETTQIHCTCRLVRGGFAAGITENDLEKLVKTAKPNSSKSFVDLNSRRRLIAAVYKTKLLGEDVFAVDVSVVQNDTMLFELPADCSDHDLNRYRIAFESSPCPSASVSKIWKPEKDETTTNARSKCEVGHEDNQEEQLDLDDIRPGQIRVIDFSSLRHEMNAHKRPVFR